MSLRSLSCLWLTTLFSIGQLALSVRVEIDSLDQEDEPVMPSRFEGLELPPVGKLSAPSAPQPSAILVTGQTENSSVHVLRKVAEQEKHKLEDTQEGNIFNFTESARSGKHQSALLETGLSFGSPQKYDASTFVPAKWQGLVADFGWKVGSGSYGVVYTINTAMSVIEDRNVQLALKMQKDKDEPFSKLEIQLGKEFDHPYVIKVWDDDNVYSGFSRKVIAMESAPKGDLTEGHKLERQIIAKVMLEMFVAMQYIHSMGYVYSDFKPEQVLLSANGIAKLGDLGLICENNFKGMAGTKKYRAPELVKTKIRTFSIDMWAMGVSLYRLVNNGLEPPALRDHPDGYIEKLKSFENHQVLHKGDSALDQLLMGLLTVNPSIRLTASEAVGYATTWAQEAGLSEHVINDVLEARLDDSKRIPLPAAWNLCIKEACWTKSTSGLAAAEISDPRPCREKSLNPLTVHCE